MNIIKELPVTLEQAEKDAMGEIALEISPEDYAALLAVAGHKPGEFIPIVRLWGEVLKEIAPTNGPVASMGFSYGCAKDLRAALGLKHDDPTPVSKLLKIFMAKVNDRAKSETSSVALSLTGDDRQFQLLREMTRPLRAPVILTLSTEPVRDAARKNGTDRQFELLQQAKHDGKATLQLSHDLKADALATLALSGDRQAQLLRFDLDADDGGSSEDRQMELLRQQTAAA